MFFILIIKVKNILNKIVQEETMNEVEETEIKNNLLIKLQNTILENKNKSKINIFSMIFFRKKNEGNGRRSK